MSFNLPWPRVYPGLHRANPNTVKRITVEFPQEQARLIMSIAANPVIYTHICQTALNAVAEYITKHDLQYTDAPALIDAICKRTIDRVVEEASAHDDAGRVTGVHDRVADAAEESTGAGKEVTGRGEGGGGRGERVGKSGDTASEKTKRGKGAKGKSG